MKQTSRRSLLKTAGLTALMPIGSSMAYAVEKDSDMPQWNQEADVVVLGFGNAGSNAAIAAADKGAKVVILEKMPKGGGNVSVSSGGFVIPTNKDDYYKFQKALYELSKSDWEKRFLSNFAMNL